MADDVAYVSRVRIKRLGGPQRLAYLPAEDDPVRCPLRGRRALRRQSRSIPTPCDHARLCSGRGWRLTGGHLRRRAGRRVRSRFIRSATRSRRPARLCSRTRFLSSAASPFAIGSGLPRRVAGRSSESMASMPVSARSRAALRAPSTSAPNWSLSESAQLRARGPLLGRSRWGLSGRRGLHEGPAVCGRSQKIPGTFAAV